MSAFACVMAIQVIGIIILAWAIVYLFTHSTSHLQTILLVMTLCVFVNFMGETGEMLSGDAPQALMAVRFSYLGKPFILYTCLLFLLEFCRIRLPRWLLWVLFIIQASVVVMAFTCPYHTLYYTSITWTTEGIFPHLVLGKSILYWIYSGIIGVYLLFFAVIVWRQLRRSTTKDQHSQAMNLLSMIVIMAASLVIYLTGVTRGYDLTLVGYTLSILFLIRAITRYNLFETLTLARDRALQDSEDGIAVLDQRGNLVLANSVAHNLLGAIVKTPLPASLDSLTEEQTKVLVAKLETLSSSPEPFESQESFYQIRTRELSKDNVSFGRIYEIKNVTESLNYSKRLEHDVDAKTQEIRRMQRAVTIGFANIVEERDDVTGTHVKNTSSYVRILTTSLQRMIAEQADNDPARMEKLWGPGYAQALEPDFLEMVTDAAPLHDLGKIAISDTILNKPGKLTDEEFDVMKTHAAKGAEIIEHNLRGLETDEYVLMAKQVAGGHHEKWNGAGYPYGLAGADIPLAARIMAIADVYDALLSQRSYKPAFSLEKAHDIIVVDAGTHFDPVLIEAFKQARAEMESVSCS